MARGGRDPVAWGVVTTYTDAAGVVRTLDSRTVDRLLDALGADGPRPALERGPLVFATGREHRLDGPAEVVLEDGTRLAAGVRLPAHLPTGYHRLEPLDGRRPARTLIVTPPRCPIPTHRRAGLAVQLYAARSQDSWGIGDLAGATRLGSWARRHGMDFLLLNPLHAPAPTLPQQPSPYSPASRRFRTPLALSVASIPGAAELGSLAAAGRALNGEPLVDRDAVWRLKLPALEQLFARNGERDRAALNAFIAEQGEPLRRFALWSALAEQHGPRWRSWPARLHRPDPPTVATLAGAHAERVRFHGWLQMQVDAQVAVAAGAIDLVTDLAVGVDPHGADAWMDQTATVWAAHVGAPPDLFNPAGQDWGLPPYDPWRAREQDYQPWTQVIRANLRHAAGLRIDHVMGLIRQWWVPSGDGPREGGYVRYPADDLLGILALEATRAGAFVVGEDLGNVDAAIRATLRRRGVLSYRLLWFEGGSPARLPRRALAAATTHDLPTIAGAWSGADVRAQNAMGRVGAEEATGRLRRRMRRLSGVDADTPLPKVVDAVHSALGSSPALLAVATLDDLLLVEERPNHPGTIDEWPNWRLALPRTLEEITADPVVACRLEHLRRPHQEGPPPEDARG